MVETDNARFCTARKELYICNPEKNTSCRKSGCVHNPNAIHKQCSCTTNPAFAKLDANGEPMKAHITIPAAPNEQDK